ncbi:MAG: class I SAM-dependent methyltransferase [Rhodoferax sp.]|uniref:class I SAM-dependent methyltransferase n=1 Tax=Rhodoferax sp. TaxID=50421 RepID=UPI0026230E99|nr:class I SAM-dependent methyltransferase [Rhodoferax sp.]MDD5336245.1 class I SAM-dependent methyltransferase [Rhodoferax sp.]
MTQFLSAQEQFLADFHDRNAGVTTRAYQSLPVAIGGKPCASSYQCLANLVAAGDGGHTVLDLACGDGYLLWLLAQQNQPQPTLIGIDLSQGELAAARTRLGASVTLLQGKAQALPLPSASADYVLCHMALMLMEQLDQVLGEVQRVLKDGAIFAFLVGARPPPGVAFDRYLARLQAIRQRHPSSSLIFGDRRLRSPEDIQALLAPGFERVVIEELVMPRRYTPQQLWTWFEDMYDLHLMPPQERQQFRDEYLEEIQALRDDDGKLAFTDSLRLVSAVVRKID